MRRSRPRQGRHGFTRTKREGDDVEAINRLSRPSSAPARFHHHVHQLTPEIIAKVVEKFVLQLEAQLATATSPSNCPTSGQWLIERGYDQQMGARPMARVIQEHIKKPLADEVLFGKLKNGGHVRWCDQRRERRKATRAISPLKTSSPSSFLRARDSEAGKDPARPPKSKRRGGGGGGGGGPKQRQAARPARRRRGHRRAGVGAEGFPLGGCRCAGSKARSGHLS